MPRLGAAGTMELPMRKTPMQLLARSALALFATASCGSSNITKTSAEKRVADWYEATGARYNLDIKDVPATIASFDPATNAGSDEINVVWKGMAITLAFGKPLNKATLTAEFLSENFSYVVLDDVFAKFDTPGWKLQPRTPTSSNEEGVQFQSLAGGHLRFTVDWETYTVMGYSSKEACQEQLQMADNSISSDCIVNVEKRLPLHLQVDATL